MCEEVPERPFGLPNFGLLFWELMAPFWIFNDNDCTSSRIVLDIFLELT